jgi:hypothetical protein
MSRLTWDLSSGTYLLNSDTLSSTTGAQVNDLGFRNSRPSSYAGQRIRLKASSISSHTKRQMPRPVARTNSASSLSKSMGLGLLWLRRLFARRAR